MPSQLHDQVSVENCSRPNAGMASHIHLKLGTGVEHPSGIT